MIKNYNFNNYKILTFFLVQLLFWSNYAIADESLDFLETRNIINEISKNDNYEQRYETKKVPFLDLDISCSKFNVEHSIFWEYDLIEVFKFTKNIEVSLRNKNLEKFLSFFRDEKDPDYFGPKTKDIIGKEFKDIFSDEWVNGILKRPFQCSPAGYRGYYMGIGELWFDNYTGSLKIRGVQFYN